MVFESFMDAVQMCGSFDLNINDEIRIFEQCRGSYVWACYAVGLATIAYNVISPILRKKKLLKQEARRRLSESL